MSICIYTILTGEYIKHAPLWIYSALYYSKDINYHFKLFVDDDTELLFLNDILNQRFGNKNWDIHVLPKFDYWQGWYSTIHRTMIERQYFNDFDYAICYEGDILFTSATFNNKNIETAIKLMDTYNLPFHCDIRYITKFVKNFHNYNEEAILKYFSETDSKDIDWRHEIGNRIPFSGFMFKVNEYYNIYEDLLNEYRYFKKTDFIDYSKTGKPYRYSIKNDEVWFYYILMKNKDVSLKLYKYSCDLINDKIPKVLLCDCENLLLHTGEYRGRKTTLKDKKKTWNWDKRKEDLKRNGFNKFMKNKNVKLIMDSYLFNKESKLFCQEFYIFYRNYTRDPKIPFCGS